MNYPSLGLNVDTAAQPWRRETVQDFFQGVAWNGPSFHSPKGSGNGAGPATSTMTMAVGNFFETIPWEGQPAIGAPILPLEAPTQARSADADLTLDGFSDLFG
ncbi:MAG: hypothetical protein ACFCVD_10535 [Nodosilinea sp.]